MAKKVALVHIWEGHRCLINTFPGGSRKYFSTELNLLRDGGSKKTPAKGTNRD